MDSCKGIILKTSYDKIGSVGNIEILGKTMLEWVSLSLCDMPFVCIDNNDELALPELIRDYLDMQKEYTVVLYSDTPLITRKTVGEAVETARLNNLNVMRMTRGFVFKTDYIATAEKIYTDKTYYFDEDDFVTAYSFKQVSFIADVLKGRILTYHMNRGVQFEDSASTFIGCEVSIGANVIIGPNNNIVGKTVIKDNARIKRGNSIEDCIIDEGAEIESSKLVHSFVGKNTTVGPFANLRKNNVIGDNCHIGDFVELKNCRIGDGSKLGHLTYAGDIIMGKKCNVGAGVVFANYDGKDKHTTRVGDRAFIGSASTIVAPVTLGNGCFIAAGSVVTQNVDEKALAIARSRQVLKPDWQGNKYTKD